MDVKIAAFPTPLRWMVVVWSGERVVRVTFGHRSARSACRAAGHDVCSEGRLTGSEQGLVERLTGLAEGQPQWFSDVSVDVGVRTSFARRVLDQCRQIPWGSTVTYGELAARSGSSRAARAVGNVMSKNPIPLIIPCHRVVAAGGALGGFSAPSGISMKKRLLAMEQSWT